MRRIETEDGPRYEVFGELLTEAEFEAKFLTRRGARDGDSLCAFPPLASDALAVHPDQVKEAIEDAKSKGLGEVEFKDDGRPVFRSRKARSAYLKAYGMFDRDAGYGDTTEGTFRGRKPEPTDIVHPETVALLHQLSRHA